MVVAQPPDMLQHHVVVVCPPSGHDGGDGSREPEKKWGKPVISQKMFSVALCVVASAVLLAGLVTLIIFLNREFHTVVFAAFFVVAAVVMIGAAPLIIFLQREFPTEAPVYSAAVTAVAGLDGDPAAATLSPVFNLTLHIDNTRNSAYRECVPDASTAAVGYMGALLASGSVPSFCAGKKRESEGAVARVWADGVVVPRNLRERLAGELAAGGALVDVKVSMPNYDTGYPGGAVLSCKVKIGGGPCPCQLDYSGSPSQGKPFVFTMPSPVPGMPPITYFIN